MYRLYPLLLALLLAASSNASANTETQKQLDQMLEEHVEEFLRDNPVRATFLGDNRFNGSFKAPISAEERQRRKQRALDWLHRADRIDAKKLDPQGQLSLDSFRFDRQTELEGLEFPQHYLPLNQFNGMHNRMPGYASGNSVQPFATVADYERFAGRAGAFAQWMKSTVPAMREGIEAGVVQPCFVVDKMLPQLQAHLVEDPQQSAFYAAVNKMPGDFSSAEQARIKNAYRELIETQILPAYREVHDFLAREYRPHCRNSVGYGDLPEGAAWYQWTVLKNTTLDMTPAEIHRIGLAEVERILKEMRDVKQQVEFDGDLQDFFTFLENDDQFYLSSEEELVQLYQEKIEDIRSRMPRLFGPMPRSELQVRPVEPYRAASAAGASYQNATADGSRPAVFYINTYNLRAQPWFLAETLTLHEALPGHYYQSALQIENTSLPRYRRYNHYTVYSEGWALYAESLGRELGLFTEPYYWYGRLVDEQLRAMRLVVDTGLHAMGWSREQAIEYMAANSSMARSDIVAEVERYIVIPGQALSYKLGDLRLQQLRRDSEQTLGKGFDIREFHQQVLEDGALPLPVLQRKLQRWIDETRQTPDGD